MTTVKVIAPATFAAFCVAVNESFYFHEGAYYLVEWDDAEAAREWCTSMGADLRATAWELADIDTF